MNPGRGLDPREPRLLKRLAPGMDRAACSLQPALYRHGSDVRNLD